jgi:hypothetical protein
MCISKCKLCLNESELHKSHIIPEFMYKPLYDDKHRFSRLTAKLPQDHKYLQKGIREYLLCSKCEEKLSNYEKYAADLLFQKSDCFRKYNDAIVFKEINYKLFKLFQLSIIWRASVCNMREFESVRLGPHEDRIRLMILNENPGIAYQYCCIIGFTPDMRLMEDLIIMPDMIRCEQHRCYRFVINGLFWIYIVSSHTDKIPKESFLSEEGILPILAAKQINDYFRKFSSEVINNKIFRQDRR